MGKLPLGSPLISVVTISYNAVKFIEQTIQSVLAQTYQYLEYIVKDGGSTDGTVDVIRRYAPRLHYWESSHDSGLSNALNVGLSKATGQWLIFLHADDFFLRPEVVEQMVPYLRYHHNADVVFGKTIIMSCEVACRPMSGRQPIGSNWNWKDFRWQGTIPHPSAFTNRKYFEKVGWFDESLRLTMDYELFLRGGKALQAQYVPVAVSGMREGGLSRREIINTLLESLHVRLAYRALPNWLAWLNFLRQLCRFYFGLVYRKVFFS